MKKYYDYLLVYLLIAFSVIPFFSGKRMLLVFVTILIAIVYLLNTKRSFPVSKPFGQILLLISLMYLGQIFTLEIHTLDFESIFGTYIRFTFPFLVLITLRSTFSEKFVKLNYVLAIVILIFWTIENIIPQFSSLVHQVSRAFSLDIESNENILIYNSEPHYSPIGLKKNAGFAYEGGAYSVILILALFFNYLEKNTLRNNESFVFILGILTTFSTAGYLSLILFLIALLFNKYKNNYYALILTIILGLTITYYFYSSIPFLEDKINSQFEIAQSDKYATAGRFASAQADLIEMQRNPIFGVGKFDETRFQIFTGKNEQHRANGLADFLAKFGALFFIGYYLIMFKSTKKFITLHNKQNNLFLMSMFIIVFLQPFSQAANQWPVYISLLYLSQINLKSQVFTQDKLN